MLRFNKTNERAINALRAQTSMNNWFSTNTYKYRDKQSVLPSWVHFLERKIRLKTNQDNGSKSASITLSGIFRTRIINASTHRWSDGGCGFFCVFFVVFLPQMIELLIVLIASLYSMAERKSNFQRNDYIHLNFVVLRKLFEQFTNWTDRV